MSGCMKERKRYECLRIGSTQAHRVRARVLLAYVHLHKREKIGCLDPGIFSYLKGSLRGAGCPGLGSSRRELEAELGPASWPVMGVVGGLLQVFCHPSR